MKFKELLEELKKDSPVDLAKTDAPQDIIDQLENLLNEDLLKIRGKAFYNIVFRIAKDFDYACNAAFGELEIKEYEEKAKSGKEEKSENRIEKFLSQFIVLQKNVATKAGIEPTRLNKIIKGTVIDFWAYEVYFISKTQNVSALKAYEDLYGPEDSYL